MGLLPMMTTFQIQIGVLALAVSTAVTTATASTASDLSTRPRVAFVPSEITLDGSPRPDIARAMCDSFTSAALKRGHYRVFNMEPQAPVKAGKGRKKQLDNLGANVSGKVSGPKPSELDFLFTFNLIGQDNHYALTMKKLQADTNEVLEAHEFTTTGRLDKVFSLVPQALERVDARKATPTFPLTQSPSAVREANSPSYAYQAAPSQSPQASLEWKNFDFSKVPKALVYRRVGSILATNDPWRFCIINPVGNSVIHRNDDVQVLWDDTHDVYSKLRVSSFDSGKVIADYGRNPSYHRLFPGDSVYGWAPPLQ